MPGSRRVQRSVRLIMATALLGVAGGLVLAAFATGGWIGAAAVGAVVLGCVAARMVYSEVVQTRLLAACEKAAQAKSFGDAMATVYAEHGEFTTHMAARLADRERKLAERDRRITELTGRLRLTQKRARDAEKRSRDALTRTKRETRRADQAERRLTEFLPDPAVAGAETSGSLAPAVT